MEPSYSQNVFSVWCPAAILNLWISEFLSHFRRLRQSLRPHNKFRKILMIRGWDEDITIFKMAAVRHVGFIVTSAYCTKILSLTLLTLSYILRYIDFILSDIPQLPCFSVLAWNYLFCHNFYAFFFAKYEKMAA